MLTLHGYRKEHEEVKKRDLLEGLKATISITNDIWLVIFWWFAYAFVQTKELGV